jgi:hypothetical protein
LIEEIPLLPAASDIVETVLGKSCAEELQKFHLQVTLWEEEYRIFQKTFLVN